MNFYKAGETIKREADQGGGFYILRKGSVNVAKGGRNIAVISEPNTIFGEMGDILKEPRTCTITAGTDGTCITHVPKDIDKIIDSHPSITKKLLVMLAKRLKATTQEMLIFDLGQEEHREGVETAPGEHEQYSPMSIRQ